MLRIRWVEKLGLRKYYKRAGEDRNFLKQLKRRAELILHISRHNSLAKRAMEGKKEGKTIGDGHIWNL